MPTPPLANNYEGTVAWRAGIEACIRHIQYLHTSATELQRPAAYKQALDDALIHIEATLEQGTEKYSISIDAPNQYVNQHDNRYEDPK